MGEWGSPRGPGTRVWGGEELLGRALGLGTLEMAPGPGGQDGGVFVSSPAGICQPLQSLFCVLSFPDGRQA